ncbi:hypothetical protein [Spirochaeta isovalerica]|uniref:Acetoin utilization deacetylase AcuC-like enzyme n=1 Tax=Spirochaeta isovalerica TaxID=150 RepID=A0A841RHT9_9SPIO|nr:hypothetical protein [Spirochaeta isovalerica]MBB6482737.1 acetoin utilization deacetylase AcuC-like enzyme [Spirochaeta isovalerica]
MRKLHIFYNENQSTTENISFSPSAGKPKLFVERIGNHPNVNIVSDFPSIKKEHLYLVHDKQHVDDVLSLKKINGFDNTIKEVTDTMLWTNASFLYASVNAVKLNTCTCSPTNGFHHAEYDGSMAFCTFNGLMLSAKILHDKGYAKRIGIGMCQHR